LPNIVHDIATRQGRSIRGVSRGANKLGPSFIGQINVQYRWHRCCSGVV